MGKLSFSLMGFFRNVEAEGGRGGGGGLGVTSCVTSLWCLVVVVKKGVKVDLDEVKKTNNV